MRSVPRGHGFRAGVGSSCEDGTWESWGADDGLSLSPNGRQVRSAITGQINDLQGADYWQMRKELPNKLSTASEINADDYPVPSYYHKPKTPQKLLQAKEQGDSDDVSEPSEEACNQALEQSVEKEKESIFMTLTEDNIFRKLYMKFTGKGKQQ